MFVLPAPVLGERSPVEGVVRLEELTVTLSRLSDSKNAFLTRQHFQKITEPQIPTSSSLIRLQKIQSGS